MAKAKFLNCSVNVYLEMRNRLQVPFRPWKNSSLVFIKSGIEIMHESVARKHYLVCAVVQLAFLAGMLFRVAETQSLARCT